MATPQPTSPILSYSFFYLQDGYQARHNYYLPSSHSEYTDTHDATNLRSYRQVLESILNSFPEGGGHGPAQISPVIDPPNGASFWLVRRELALFRSKDLGEIQVFLGGLEQHPMGTLEHLYQQVYTPQVTGYYGWDGCMTTAPGEPERLWYTLRDPGNETVDIEADGTCGNTASALVFLSNLDAARPGVGVSGDLQLNLECSVSVEGLRGRVYVYAPDESEEWDWRAIEVGDFGDDANAFGFFAPARPDTDRYETRRTFTIPRELLPNDTATLKIAFYDPFDNITSFDASFDLVQPFWQDGWDLEELLAYLDNEGQFQAQSQSQHGGETPGRAQGADVNHDGVIDIRDLQRFNMYYGNSLPAADFNYDGVINSQDMADFLAAYGS